MVLADDDFATIVAAVEEGRTGPRQYPHASSATCSPRTRRDPRHELVAVPDRSSVPAAGVQILWVNLVTDGLPALALGVEPTERGTMHRPPRSPSELLFARGLWQHTIWVGLLMASVALGVQAFAIGQGWPWQTMVFATLALLQLGHALAIRSETDSLFRLGLRSNLPLTLAVAGTFVVQMALIFIPALRPNFRHGRADPAATGVGRGRLDRGFAAVEVESGSDVGRPGRTSDGQPRASAPATGPGGPSRPR